MINYLSLILAFLLTFFIVGFVLTELFFSEFARHIKFPLYFVLSIVASTYIVYFASFAFGLSTNTARITLYVFIPIAAYLFYKRRIKLGEFCRKHYPAFLIAAAIVAIYIAALYPAILAKHDNYYVMSGPNWQDTAMHLSIVQSLTQGNFPPQAPYFSGAPLGYYYFSDLHSAIISLIYNRFFPRVFVYDNALLAGVAALCLYFLAYGLSKNTKLSIASMFIGSFYGSFIFVKFFQLAIGGGNVWNILANNSFSLDYGHLFGMANISDNFLQNRPMMVGIPVVLLIIMLLFNAFKDKSIKLALVAGLLTAALIKFQFFCVLAGVVAMIIVSTPLFKSRDFKFILRSYLAFILPIFAFYLLLGTKSVNGVSFFNLFKSTFHLGSWDSTRSVIWHLEFLILNLGLPFLLTLVAFINRRDEIKIISLLALVFTAIPYLVSFTIAEADMLKFFYFSILLFAVIVPYFLAKIIKSKLLFITLIGFIIIVTTFSSILTLANSFLNKNQGYSEAAYTAGMWVRNNTIMKSVFVTMPTVHSAPSDLGGRPRIISYTNWPYTHGFNRGDDNVFTRSEDVEEVYKTGDISVVKLKYGAKYLYYGEDEKSDFPSVEAQFDTNKDLKKIYNQGGILIYEII